MSINSNTKIQRDPLGIISKSGMCDALEEDSVQEFCLLLMAKFDGKFFAAGTSTVLGSGIWIGPEGPETILVAVTARHCLSNLFKEFQVPEPRPLLPGLPIPTFRPPWTLCGGQITKDGMGLWSAMWQCSGYDDLALIYWRPVNEIARRTTFAQPVISYFSPEISTDLWGFGFGGCRTIMPPAEAPNCNFESGRKLSKGQIVQYLDGTRQERWVTDMPVMDGMSGGPVFWKDRLVGLFSSKLEGGAEHRSFVMRIQMIIHFELDGAPILNGQKFAKVSDLAEHGIIATLPTCQKIDSVKAVPRYDLEVWTRQQCDTSALISQRSQLPL